MNKWPEDMEFTRFSRLIADRVTVFINRGLRIRPSSTGYELADCNCPIGAVTGIRYPYGCLMVADVAGARAQNMFEFIAGFDDKDSVNNSPYARLGMAYRERFGY